MARGTESSTNIRLGEVWVKTEEYYVGAWFAWNLPFLSVGIKVAVVGVLLWWLLLLLLLLLLLGPLCTWTTLVVVVVATLFPALRGVVALRRIASLMSRSRWLVG